ncbi:MAG TPA: ArsI/CadI family heavy metal resistance metalloenzyme [Ilumatobacteraceae bacterium]|nr:ArsI/CadI family heavy metal resistance metalloenzyme [Ilumatobacteraceae bacterium]
MSRVQLALNVGDLDASIEFYTKLFQTPPAKVRENYANFAIAEPPLKLVLFAGDGEPGTLNHLGVEVETTAEVSSAAARMQAEGLSCEVQDSTTCCFAVQDKVWVTGPEIPWEIYTVLADAPVMRAPDDGCCATAEAEPAAVGAEASACC